ncbi:unnamed protein product [Thlaspi arvense]|uniref:RBR-type E3 ubiquitin transferase n=1 Tax=Thlaspi arvense TaxID=13288 RepID=A0AAU9S3J7_THLAR|nr:unnamed protein product [Thlaspi arvense]
MGSSFSSSSPSTSMDVSTSFANYYSNRVFDGGEALAASVFQPSDEDYAYATELHLQEVLAPSVFQSSDEDYVYATELHFQEALLSSMIASTAEINHHPQLQRNISTRIHHEEPEIKNETEPAEASRRLQYCMICMDEKPSSEIFQGNTNCTHSYCTECTARYVATKIEENVAMIKCPDVNCTVLIEPHVYRDLIPKDVSERWDKGLCESLIVSSEKVYCPFKDCSAMMVVDDDDAKVTESECPSCHRLFCGQCKVMWHAGIGCEEFQRFGNKKRSLFFKAISTITNKKNKMKRNSDEEDALLIQMAKNKHWRRCPSCKFYVEKDFGCMHISCRNLSTGIKQEEPEIKIENEPNYTKDLEYEVALFASSNSSKDTINHHPQLQRNLSTGIKQEEPEIRIENEPAEPNNTKDLDYQESLFASFDSLTAKINHHPQVQRNLSTSIKQEEPEIKIENEPNYTKDLDYEEALFASLNSSTATIKHHPQLQRNLSTGIKQEEPEIKIENEPAEPSSRLRYCMICMDEKPSSEIFPGNTNCTHSYCTECTVRYVATKIEENVAMIKCPDVDCTVLIEPYTCRDLIPKDVSERWDKGLCESLILSSEKVYCPFEDCPAMMVVDDDDQGSDAKVTETECPSCHRLFCAQCKVTWHAGIGCEEFQRLGNTKKKKSSDEEDDVLIQMAKYKQRMRCPSCKFYVEKVDGCMHIKCRCGYKFCYRCGLASNHFFHVCRIRDR